MGYGTLNDHKEGQIEKCVCGIVIKVDLARSDHYLCIASDHVIWMFSGQITCSVPIYIIQNFYQFVCIAILYSKQFMPFKALSKMIH